MQGESLPLARRNGCFCAKVGVDGGEPGWMRVDTGCDSAMEWVTPPGDAAGKRMRAQVRLGTITLPAVEIGRHAEPFFTGERGLIGNGLLARFCVTLDASRKQLILSQR